MKKTLILVMILHSALLLSGCGAAQSVAEGTASVAKAMFVWDVRTLHLDYLARAELNVDDNSQSSPVVIRMYQLTETKAFDAANYAALVTDDQTTLGDTLLASKEIVLQPNTALSVDTPLEKAANYVAVVALFKEPDLQRNSWRLLLERGDLHINQPRQIIANQFTLELVAED